MLKRLQTWNMKVKERCLLPCNDKGGLCHAASELAILTLTNLIPSSIPSSKYISATKLTKAISVLAFFRRNL